ncbi:MAG: hypothetical protein CME61_03065 [Halobacteriovoraceae bacterium]|nr:hypothetical protein [Halobacteriovoraceae bacterium]
MVKALVIIDITDKFILLFWGRFWKEVDFDKPQRIAFEAGLKAEYKLPKCSNIFSVNNHLVHTIPISIKVIPK